VGIFTFYLEHIGLFEIFRVSKEFLLISRKGRGYLRLQTNIALGISIL